MKLVIDISDETYYAIMDDAENTPRNLSYYERIIANGTPLPKGHGRLIDGDDLESRMKIGYNIVRNAPTIIEADGGESEDKE